MRRSSFVIVAIAIALMASIPLVAAPAGASPRPVANVPTTVDACKHGGWHTLTDPVAAPFTSRSGCVLWATNHPGGALRLADLGGAFTGTESFTFECSFVHQIFDATYPSHGRVGTATLGIEGCVSNPITTFTGTFSISTTLGSVSGTVAGTIGTSGKKALFHLELTTTATTGAFTGLSGALDVDILWRGSPATAVTGTVKVAAPI